LLRDILDIRRKKICAGMKQFETHPTEVNVTGMSAAELTCFRTRSLYVLDKFLDLLRAQRVSEKEQGPTQDDSMGYTENVDSFGS